MNFETPADSSGFVADVLLAEDNDDDYHLASEGFKRSGIAVRLHRVTDGRECLNFLRKTSEFAGAPTPHLLLLDLNMPLLCGRDVLCAIVKDPELRRLPVIVLSTSTADRDVQDLYDLRCNAYLPKPVDFEEFREAIRCLCEFWFRFSVLPTAR